MAGPDATALLRLAPADGRARAPAPINLGARVRDLRRERRWTLEQAAREAGLARSTLSKIENGRMSPTYDALKKLAAGLGLSIPELFAPAPGAEAAGRIAVTRMGEGAAQLTATYEHRLLAGALPRTRMTPCRTRIRARRLEEFGGWVRHEGEAFLYVLTGTLRLVTELYEPVDMRRGDSAYYDAAMGHNVVSTSPEDATVLWVTSPS